MHTQEISTWRKEGEYIGEESKRNGEGEREREGNKIRVGGREGKPCH
jgi:hypothetical protein